MSKFCEVCNKGVMSGNRVSHSNRKTPHAWAPNIQRVSVVVDGTVTKMNVCTQVYWPAYESEVTGRLEEMTAAVTLRVKDIDNEEIDVKVGDEDWLLGVYGGRTSEEAYIANQN